MDNIRHDSCRCNIHIAIRCIIAAEGTGIEHIKATLIFLKGNMRMAKKHNIGLFFSGSHHNFIIPILYSVDMPMGIIDFLSFQGNFIRKGKLGSPIAVSPHL